MAGVGNEAWLGTTLIMGVVFLAALHPIRIPGTTTSITPNDIFIFLAALFWGAAAATLVGATDAVAASFKSSRRWTSRIGSPALMSIAVFLSASLFERGVEWLRELQLFNSALLFTSLLAFALVYFSLISSLLAAHTALKNRARFFAGWLRNYGWAVLTYTASASTAGLIYLAISYYGISSLLAAGPIVAIIFATCHFYFKQAEERASATERISRVHLATVEALATAIDAKDQITHDHVYRVQVYAAGVARHFGLDALEIEALKAGAILHDVGKIAVPDYILNKPGKLTAAEFDKMKIHTIVGAKILERVGFPYPVVPIVRHHHERWDGRGYPDGLRGEHIPMTARILTVVDCFDAVREDRQYRKALTRDEACQFLRDNAGTQFDPRIVEAFITNLARYEEEIVAHKASLQPMLTPTTQQGLSESGLSAVPAAGLAEAEPFDYMKQIQAAHAEVATLYEMAQTFSASLDVRDVVTLTVNRIERMIPFTTCVFYLKRASDDAALASYAFGQNAEKISGRALAAGHGIAGWVIINGRAMNNTDAMLDLANFVGANDSGYRTAAVYPLKNGEDTMGALALYSSEVGSYTGEQLHLIESVARLASTALVQAILHEQTRASAQTDALTGLPNGRALYAHFDQELAEARESGSTLAVVSFNVAGMRAINDAYGYQSGDRALAAIARRLRGAIDDSLLLSRVAGDEFICLLKGADRHRAIDVASRAQEEVARFSFEVRPGQAGAASLNYGLAVYPADGQSVDELMGRAAMATRESKTASRLHASPPASVAYPFPHIPEKAGEKPIAING
jgi:diguanylate cyclase (GGDEF)-like protein/putative nucleotidyltransferase with HDIG domain